jgi:hypothetical protein
MLSPNGLPPDEETARIACRSMAYWLSGLGCVGSGLASVSDGA